MKTYVLTLSHSFPANHAMHGKPTYFREKFRGTLGMLRKLHTIRANYTLWAKRFEKIAAGDACLSVREWMDAPYRSKQREIARLTKEDGIGLQKLQLEVADKLFGKYHVRIDDIMCGTSNAERAYLEDLYNEVTKPHWISVKDELPEACVAVLTTTQHGTQRVGCYEDGWWLANSPNLVRMGSITHWMPLPAPPTGDKSSPDEKGGKEC